MIVPGNQERNFAPELGKNFGDRENGRLRIQSIEDRFDEEQVDPALEETAHLLGIGSRTCSKVTARNPGSFTSGESEVVTGSGPNEPATKRDRPLAFAIRSAAPRAIRAAAKFISWTSAPSSS